jgi:hypothetical protein
MFALLEAQASAATSTPSSSTGPELAHAGRRLQPVLDGRPWLKIMLKVAVQDIGQVTDFDRGLALAHCAGAYVYSIKIASATTVATCHSGPRNHY